MMLWLVILTVVGVVGFEVFNHYREKRNFDKTRQHMVAHWQDILSRRRAINVLFHHDNAVTLFPMPDNTYRVQHDLCNRMGHNHLVCYEEGLSYEAALERSLAWYQEIQDGTRYRQGLFVPALKPVP